MSIDGITPVSASAAEVCQPSPLPAAAPTAGRRVSPYRGPAVTWHLSGRAEPQAPVQDVLVSGPSFTIGRRAENSLCLANTTVSGSHAELICRENRLYVKDLNSTNGTFVNGRRINDLEVLCDGDRLQIGTAVFVASQHREPIWGATVAANVAHNAMAYVQFEKLLGDPAVIPFFQPIVRLDDLQCLGYEVLARSQLAGLEMPSMMFRVASELSSEVALSCLLRREGLRHGRALGAQTPLYLNTHPTEIGMPGLLDALRALRDEFPDSCIVLEIHEAAVTSPQTLSNLREQLQRLEIRLAYDDFGAGQARLLELADVPPDVIKFDLQMIHGLPEATPEKRQMVASLVQMVRSLGVVPLAEGVETLEEATVCQELGFELAQGYFFGYPSPVGAWLPPQAH
jgi:EAL domain-containing protein (putative c-di-GMP-specific phosphodiesterase class I)